MKSREPRKRDHSVTTKIAALYWSGLSADEVAAACGVSIEVVNERLIGLVKPVKMLDLSTGHVSEETARFLDTGAFGYVKGGYGWFVPCVPIPPASVPDDLRNVMAYARALDCEWLMFDRDADILPGLPTFDW